MLLVGGIWDDLMVVDSDWFIMGLFGFGWVLFFDGWVIIVDGLRFMFVGGV